jgi:large-conductance mechanosensitive channel
MILAVEVMIDTANSSIVTHLPNDSIKLGFG